MATIVRPIGEVMQEFGLAYEEYEALPAAAKEVLLGMGGKHLHISRCYKSWGSEKELENALVDELAGVRRGVRTAEADIERAEEDYSAARRKYIAAGGIDHSNEKRDLDSAKWDIAWESRWGSGWRPSDEAMQIYDLTTERFDKLPEKARKALRNLDESLDSINMQRETGKAMADLHDFMMKRSTYAERTAQHDEITELRGKMQNGIKRYDLLEKNCEYYRNEYIRAGGIDYTKKEEGAQKRQKLEQPTEAQKPAEV